MPAVGRPFRRSSLLAVAYLLLGLCWAFTNPAGAAPDEPDHLVKALGNATWQVGVEPPSLPSTATALEQRNRSTTRTFLIPKKLNPRDLTCFAFNPTITAACQPNHPPRGRGELQVASAVADYPPFLYVPIGTAARLASTPHQAFIAARVVVSVIFAALLWLGMAQVTRWLGQSALLGFVLAVTPVEVFLGGSVSISALEFAAAAAVAAVVTSCALRQEALYAPSTHWTLLVAGSGLALSRQLGVLTLAIFILILLAAVGVRVVPTLMRARSVSLIACIAVVAISTGLGLWWERTYDHPAVVASPVNRHALAAFVDSWPSIQASGVGVFGWLDTPLPGPATELWIAGWVVVITFALILGCLRDSLVVLGALGVTIALAFVTYASAFYPVGASEQGRHILPTASLAIVFAGAVIAHRLPTLAPAAGGRVYVTVAALIACVQILALYCNGRRYAVGTGGPWWWVTHAQWSPPAGWTVWLVLTVLAGLALGWGVARLQPSSQASSNHTAPATVIPSSNPG